METNLLAKVFIEDGDVPWEMVDKGVKRKIMAYDDHLMLVKVAFDADGVGAIHQHIHSQITYIESGKFEVEIDGQRKILTAGDVFFIPTNWLHGAVCLEKGVLIDVFSPMREDFIK